MKATNRDHLSKSDWVFILLLSAAFWGLIFCIVGCAARPTDTSQTEAVTAPVAPAPTTTARRSLPSFPDHVQLGAHGQESEEESESESGLVAESTIPATPAKPPKPETPVLDPNHAHYIVQTGARVAVLRYYAGMLTDAAYRRDWTDVIVAALALRELTAEWMSTGGGASTPTSNMTADQLIESFSGKEEANEGVDTHEEE